MNTQLEPICATAQPICATAQPAPLNATEEQVFNLLASGLPASMVASSLSISESYISQLLSNSEFRDRVSSARLSKSKNFIARDEKLELTEAKALERLSLLLPMITKPAEAAKIYQVLNNAKRTVTALPTSNSPSTQTVVLNLPKTASVSFTLSHATNQVMEVDGRSMAPLPASKVKELMTDKSMVRTAQGKLMQAAAGLLTKDDI